MIKFLAQVFRGLHYIVGISEPPAGTSDRTFVFAWLGGIAFTVAVLMILMYYIAPFLYIGHGGTHGSKPQTRNERQGEQSIG